MQVLQMFRGEGEIFDVRGTSHGGKLFLKYYIPMMSMTVR